VSDQKGTFWRVESTRRFRGKVMTRASTFAAEAEAREHYRRRRIQGYDIRVYRQASEYDEGMDVTEQFRLPPPPPPSSRYPNYGRLTKAISAAGKTLFTRTELLQLIEAHKLRPWQTLLKLTEEKTGLLAFESREKTETFYTLVKKV